MRQEYTAKAWGCKIEFQKGLSRRFVLKILKERGRDLRIPFTSRSSSARINDNIMSQQIQIELKEASIYFPADITQWIDKHEISAIIQDEILAFHRKAEVRCWLSSSIPI